MVFLMNQFDPKTNVMIHFTKRPIKCSYIMYFIVWKVALNNFDETIMYFNKKRLKIHTSNELKIYLTYIKREINFLIKLEISFLNLLCIIVVNK